MPEEQTTQTTPPAPQVGTIPTPEEVVKDVKKGNFNKSILLVIGLIILTVVLLVLSFMVKKSSRAPSATTKTQNSFAQTNLSISENPRVASTSGSYETDVNITSGANKITGAELVLSFDPKVLTNVDIKPGSFISGPTVIQKQIDTTQGTIKLIFGTSRGAKGVSGTGQLAVISFTKTSAENTDINFLPDTLISAEGYDQSVLSKTSSAVIGSLPTQ